MRDELIEHNLRLVVYIARKYESSGIGVEDLISIGSIGLIKAINSFQPSKGIKLATYASRCIENEILMTLRKTHNLRHDISIDEPLTVDWDGNELLLSDILGTDGDVTSLGIEEREEREALLRAVATLGERERKIMEYRFGMRGEEKRKGCCGFAGDLPILHFTTGKENSRQASQGDGQDPVTKKQNLEILKGSQAV